MAGFGDSPHRTLVFPLGLASLLHIGIGRSAISQKTKTPVVNPHGDTLLYQCTGLKKRRFAALENSPSCFRGLISTLLSADQ